VTSILTDFFYSVWFTNSGFWQNFGWGKFFFNQTTQKGGKAMRYGKKTNEWVLRQMSCVFMGLFVFLFAGVFSQAQAIECNGKIEKNTSLDADLDCSTFGDTALTVVGPASLDLNGFEVICASGKDGIVLEGKGATILNGTVSGGRRGIRLRGEGYHRVVNMRVIECNTGENPRGIRVESPNNELKNNYIENSVKGIRVEDYNNNLIDGNTMVDNDAENCDVRGSENLIVNNIAKGGKEECFLIGDLEGEEDKQTANDNLFQNNVAINCKAGGFVAASGTWGNSFIRNTAFGNAPSVDLIDFNKNCYENDWIMNTAGSGKPKCTTFPGIIQHFIFGK
jgi:parallel beta-helix repeat protein